MYCTLDDLKKDFPIERLIELTDRDSEPTGGINVAVVDRAIERATDEINRYLRMRYAVPLSPVPQDIRDIACDIAFYYLRDDAVEELTKERYEHAIKWLQGVADGRYDLAVAPAPVLPGSGGVAIKTNDRVFTRASLSGYER